MTINAIAMENNYLESAKRSAYDLFETYNGDDKAVIQERLAKLDRQLNKIENACERDYQVHKLLNQYAAISDDCKKTVSEGGFFARLKKLIVA